MDAPPPAATKPSIYPTTSIIRNTLTTRTTTENTTIATTNNDILLQEVTAKTTTPLPTITQTKTPSTTLDGDNNGEVELATLNNDNNSNSNSPSKNKESMTNNSNARKRKYNAASWLCSSNRGTNNNTSMLEEIWYSTEQIFESRLTWLLVLAPFALLNDKSTSFGEMIAFTFSGIVLIPCAERLSFVTEQVALHTNGTIGALLNATFGNAPEFLIATAALRSGYYRVVQLAMLGSILSNLLLVFGLSCFIGGLRWQVQDVRTTSGNVSVQMLLLGTGGSLLPAALFMSGQLPGRTSNSIPTEEELQFSRVNAAVLMVMYLSYLLFQLGTHAEEFSDDFDNRDSSHHESKFVPRRNEYCRTLCDYYFTRDDNNDSDDASQDTENEFRSLLSNSNNNSNNNNNDLDPENIMGESNEYDDSGGVNTGYIDDDVVLGGTNNITSGATNRRRRNYSVKNSTSSVSMDGSMDEDNNNNNNNNNNNGIMINGKIGSSKGLNHNTNATSSSNSLQQQQQQQQQHHPKDHRYHPNLDTNRSSNESNNKALLSLRMGILWLLIITLCISSMSDILVESLDGFVLRLKLSGVFTSIIIVPYFSNVAEQVSAVIFAFKNEMDLCVGVTVGSAIQISAFVLPGTVLIGWWLDRSMTLFFHGYETTCLFLSVLCITTVLQGGKANWFIGICLIGIYVLIATGFWFHEMEQLSVDAEIVIRNVTNNNDNI